MRLPEDLPGLAIVRVITGGGPYRVDQTISLAFASPAVGRMVGHGPLPFETDVSLEEAVVPETIAVTVVHPADPYELGDMLALSFVHPHVARIHRSEKRNDDRAGRRSPSYARKCSDPRDLNPQSTHNGAGEGVPSAYERDADATLPVASSQNRSGTPTQSVFESVPRERVEREGVECERFGRERFARSVTDNGSAEQRHKGDGLRTTTFWDERVEQRTLEAATAAHEPPEVLHGPALESEHATPGPLAGNRSSERVLGERLEGHVCELEPIAPTQPDETEWVVAGSDIGSGASAEAILLPEPNVGNDAHISAGPAKAFRGFGVHVRLHWSGDRVGRFIGVVDKLFTVGRLGWYRHALAMRLLIPDEVTSYDSLGDMEAMRHLHALRAAAVETLGRPLLTAFMPNFSVSAQWLATIDSVAAAQALAGLRNALSPYVDDEATLPALEASWTVGGVERRELLGESATSVDALLPVLIPTASPNVVLTQRLYDYRRMLIDVFGQTARSAEVVRVNTMAQTNHALDDRLWQLVGAVAEAFNGLAVA